MARHHVKRADSNSGEHAPLPGGSLGMPAQAAPGAGPAEIVVPGLVVSRGRPEPAKEVPLPLEFVVRGGPTWDNGRVVVFYDSQRVTMMIGKVVSEVTHDLDVLRRQGVVLEAVSPPPPAAEAVSEAADPL